MARGGPKRLGVAGLLASIYPCLFAWFYCMSERLEGKEIARFRALSLLTLSVWLPLLMLGGSLIANPVGLTVFVALHIAGGFVTIYLVHRHLLIRKRVGLRFVERYDTLEFPDQMWVQALTIAFSVLYVFVCARIIIWAAAHRPVIAISYFG